MTLFVLNNWALISHIVAEYAILTLTPAKRTPSLSGCGTALRTCIMFWTPRKLFIKIWNGWKTQLRCIGYAFKVDNLFTFFCLPFQNRNLFRAGKETGSHKSCFPHTKKKMVEKVSSSLIDKNIAPGCGWAWLLVAWGNTYWAKTLSQ